MLTKKQRIVMKTWDELSPELQEDFKKMLVFVGSKDLSLVKDHTYQVLDGKAHGFIHSAEYYKSLRGKK